MFSIDLTYIGFVCDVRGADLARKIQVKFQVTIRNKWGSRIEQCVCVCVYACVYVCEINSKLYLIDVNQ